MRICSGYGMTATDQDLRFSLRLAVIYCNIRNMLLVNYGFPGSFFFWGGIYWNLLYLMTGYCLTYNNFIHSTCMVINPICLTIFYIAAAQRVIGLLNGLVQIMRLFKGFISKWYSELSQIYTRYMCYQQRSLDIQKYNRRSIPSIIIDILRLITSRATNTNCIRYRICSLANLVMWYFIYKLKALENNENLHLC